MHPRTRVSAHSRVRLRTYKRRRPPYLGLVSVRQLCLEFLAARYARPQALFDKSETSIMLGTILLILLVLMLLGAVPVWPHSRGWGYAPSGVISLVLVLIIVLLLLGRL